MTVLPDYLTEQTEEAILKRMLDRVPSDLDKAEGSFIWDALAPAAHELYAASLWAQEVLRRGFASTTYGAYLDARCEEHGVERNLAQKAKGMLAIAGTPGVVVPAGTVVATPADAVTNTSSIEFATDADVRIDEQGVAAVGISALLAGTQGNVLANAISLLATSIAGVTSVRNLAPISGGTNDEADEALLARLLLKLRQPATSGNAAQYRQWALDVPGVGDARVFPLWDGAGTVKLAIANEDLLPAGAALATAVADYIETVRPIGAAVTVAPAEAKSVSLQATVALAEGYAISNAIDGFKTAVRDYFRSIAFQTSYVSYAKIGTLLLDVPGVIDYTGLLVNGASVNVALADTELPVLGVCELAV